ncbi:competence protein CoiA [Carnobacterium iners]|uniref:Competence protein CoiA n=1 Tax=Carnobacterium iners TaxID=1073423 RepID=A0A1X7NPJ9_9LACT|nr:competence protein CoiA family protein [Carnobacterium iners]SEK28552.1 competence protein CoiA [Carnobacterium iners]SMH39915.1 competence protein CoiA [Carnobacterium iners]
MLVALDEKNELIYANSLKEVAQTTNHYYCPNCKDYVFLKKGSLKVAHFSHFSQTNCSSFSEGETREHLQGKQLLYEWFTKQGLICQLEAYLPNLNQRPDILVWISQTKAIAIEFQCSSLPLKRMIERTVGYKSKGYDVLWIVGSQFKLDDKITAFQRLFIYGNAQIKSSLFFLDVIKRTVYFYSNIQQKNTTQKITYDKYLIKLDQFTLVDVPVLMKKISNKTKSKKSEELPKSNELMQSHNFLNQGRMYQTPEVVLFQKYIYHRGDSLISLPKEIYLVVTDQIMIKTLPHFWKYILLKWLSQNNIHSVITLKQLDKQINEMIKNKEIIFYKMPLLSLEEQKKPLYCYIRLLIKVAILEEKDSNQWILRRKPYYYKNEQEKMASFSKEFSLSN